MSNHSSSRARISSGVNSPAAIALEKEEEEERAVRVFKKWVLRAVISGVVKPEVVREANPLGAAEAAVGTVADGAEISGVDVIWD